MTNWKELVDECAPLVISISWRILGNAADAEDNVQDVFLEACRIQRRATVRHWRGLMRRIAILKALAKRRQRRQHASLSEGALDLRSPSPDESAMRQEEDSRLRDAVAALPEREGAVFALRYFEGLDLPEIAECLGISYAAAGTALSRARTKLTLIFSEMAPERNDGREKNPTKLPFAMGRTKPGLA